MLTAVRGIEAVAAAGASDWTRELRLALAAREGAIVPLETQTIAPERFVVERHLCIDTTAAGGNATLSGRPRRVGVQPRRAQSTTRWGHDSGTATKKGLQHRCKPLNSWRARQDSNLRPSASEADTLSN